MLDTRPYKLIKRKIPQGVSRLPMVLWFRKYLDDDIQSNSLLLPSMPITSNFSNTKTALKEAYTSPHGYESTEMDFPLHANYSSTLITSPKLVQKTPQGNLSCPNGSISNPLDLFSKPNHRLSNTSPALANPNLALVQSLMQNEVKPKESRIQVFTFQKHNRLNLLRGLPYQKYSKQLIQDPHFQIHIIEEELKMLYEKLKMIKAKLMEVIFI